MTHIKTLFIAALSALIITASPAAKAYPPSVVGGAPMQPGTAHNIGLGWPSIMYEWWHSGVPDWALGAELVYGDWSGAFSDMTIGLGLNAPFRFHLATNGRADFALRIAPGVLIADAHDSHEDIFVLGLRGEFAMPVSVGISPKVNLITGLAAPVAVYIPEHGDTIFVFPILIRLGVEFLPQQPYLPWLLVEVGPTIGHRSGHTEVDPGFRIWIGTTIW
ncbi:MAG: hypothetical protein V1798_01960 [Pseudomonadota bacterium]